MTFCWTLARECHVLFEWPQRALRGLEILLRKRNNCKRINPLKERNEQLWEFEVSKWTYNIESTLHIKQVLSKSFQSMVWRTKKYSQNVLKLSSVFYNFKSFVKHEFIFDQQSLLAIWTQFFSTLVARISKESQKERIRHLWKVHID